VTNDELTDAWEAGALGRGITHEEHLRISWALVRRHGRDEGGKRIVDGTRENCLALGVPERFDEDLSERWVHAVADAVSDGRETFGEFLDAYPDLARSDLFGKPAWTRAQ
jgi:hypothetical protein